MTNLNNVVEADLTWTGSRFETGVRIGFGRDGTIAGVWRPGESAPDATSKMTGRALLPGFINTHSHAFQRGLRGRGESFPGGAGSFWTWREAMYDLVERMTPELIYDLSRQAFSEMLAAGITTVGEFHYLHHDASGKGFACDEAVLRAAADAGIRIVLLQAFYKTGAIGKPLQGGQARFATPELQEYWSQFDRLASLLDSRTQSLGVVAHSIRAVPLDDLVELHRESVKRGCVFHMHVEEQPAEIEQCTQAYGKAPMALLNEKLDIDDRFTAIHCTHTADADMERFLTSGGGGNVCICPLTEANLGDGLADVPGILGHGGHICLGTDSNSRLCMTEEMHLLEYGQRLTLQKRGVCIDDSGALGPVLFDTATQNGARSLGLGIGKVEPGRLADFVAIDLETPSLVGWTDDSLLDAVILGTGNEAIAESCVGGIWREE